MELTAFASVCPQDIYEGDITPSEVAVWDPEEEEDVGGQLTFPWAYREDLIGLNATVSRGERRHLGATAWVGHLQRRYDFTFSSYAMSDRPYFGAAGVDGAWGAGALDLRGEVALTDTGGFGARAESLTDVGALEAEVAFRWYGAGFDNPHARALAQPDEYGLSEEEVEETADRTGGWRDRDELGPQVELVLDPLGWLRIRGRGDVWYQPTEGVTDGWAELRADVDPLPWAGLDLVASDRDKDLSQGGREQTYEASGDALQAGMKASFGAGLRVQPWEPILLQAFVRQSLYDHGDYDDRFAIDRYGWLRLGVDFGEQLEVVARVGRYVERAESDEEGGAYDDLQGQVQVRVRDRCTLLGRYEQVRPLGTDDPEPEHELELGLDLQF